MRFIYVGLAAALLATGSARAVCPSGEGESGPIYLAERNQLSWCWEPVSGGVGPISYVVESRTNNGGWELEGETDLPDWTLERALGDKVRIRYQACDDLGCGDFSSASRPAFVYPDFDSDGSGVVTIADLNPLRRTITNESLDWFRKVYGKRISGDRYD